jgi:hypothetical protein
VRERYRHRHVAGRGRPRFRSVYTTKPLGEGTGLGLSVIYGFVRQSGGQVRIYSEVGKGTMVCLYLPRHPRSRKYRNACGEIEIGRPPRSARRRRDRPSCSIRVVEAGTSRSRHGTAGKQPVAKDAGPPPPSPQHGAVRLWPLAELWSDPTLTFAAIARELGMGVDSVHRRAKKLGLEGRTVADRQGSRKLNITASTSPRNW